MLLAIEPEQPPPKINQRKCVYCSSEIPSDALKCSHCGSRVLVKPVTMVPPILAALASCLCLAGLGQMLAGQVGKGLVLILVCVVAGLATSGLAALILWPLMAVDAFMVANKQQKGKPVGPWEFFPS